MPDDIKAEATPRPAIDTTTLTAALSVPAGFKINPVANSGKIELLVPAPPSLGALAAFVGNWTGSGFNTIFRPDLGTTTPLPVPVASDNVLELNLTSETLSFAPSLGSIPNRGTVQGDIFLNGVPYLQVISDVTVPHQTVGIHFEPGLWISVPATTDPADGPTLVRMASIPHGATIEAQGTSTVTNGAPTIPPVDITPFTGGGKIRFPSQTAATPGTARIPQDFSTILPNVIDQAMLDDPNSVLRNHIAGLDITSTTTISIATKSAQPPFGGGIDNIAFLLGNAAGTAANANTVTMTATFWIETVEHSIIVPPFTPGHPPLTISADPGKLPDQLVPKFMVLPPTEITVPRQIKVTTTQIQYSQVVNLFFNGLTWPHVSVATLIPAGPIPVPFSGWN